MVRYSDFCSNIDSQFFDYDYARDNLNQTKSSAVNEIPLDQVSDGFCVVGLRQ